MIETDTLKAGDIVRGRNGDQRRIVSTDGLDFTYVKRAGSVGPWSSKPRTCFKGTLMDWGESILPLAEQSDDDRAGIGF